MKTVATNKKLRELIVGIENGSLIARPDFQRRLVWTNKEKIAFIDTVIQGYPFPEIYIAAGAVDENSGMAVEYLVDGQQRITTLYQYFKGAQTIEIPVGFPKYSDLEPERKKEFLQYDVVVRDLGNLSIEEIKSIFQKINSTSYSLNAMEIHNSRFNGEFKSFGEKVAEKEFFNTKMIFTTNDIRRMQDLRYCLILISTMLSGYFDQSSKVEEFLENYNDEFPKALEIEERIDGIMKFIDDCNFDIQSRVWNKSDLFTLIIELDKKYFSQKNQPDLKQISENLKTFYFQLSDKNLTNDLAKYHNAAIQGSNSRSRRIERAEVLRSII